MTAKRYTKTYTTSLGDLDVNYRLTKVAAIKYFQESFALYCATKNVAAFDVYKDNLVWVIADFQVEFSEIMPYWSEKFTVEIWISEKSKMRTYCDFKIFYKDTVIAKGESCWYLIDMQTRRPVKSEEILSCLNTHEEKIFGSHEKYSFDFEGEKISQKEHEVTIRDLDFNYHVNNLSYVGLFLETVPSEYIEKNDIKTIKVKFVQEAYLSDLLSCEVFQAENEIKGKIYKKSDSSEVCLISSTFKDKKDLGRNPREAGVSFAD